MSKTKKMCVIAILVACASILSIIDRYVSGLIIPTLPGVKIGIANIVILITLTNFNFKEGFLVVILKSIIGGFMLFGFTSLIIGGTASIVCYLLMCLTKHIFKDKVSLIGISIIGGISHIIAQLLVISIMYKMGSIVFTYGAWLLLVSFITSIIIGILSISINKILVKNIFKVE